jgi:hypothetical protein
MARIRQRRDRHFIDDHGQLFWINGPDHHCYLSEQRQWRQGLSFEEVLEWKQCSPSGLVSQRFTSLQAACEAFEHHQITWSLDLYLRRMGDDRHEGGGGPRGPPPPPALAQRRWGPHRP